MILDKSHKLVTNLDFRGTKIEYLDKLTAKEMLLIVATIQQLANKMEAFTVKQLAPEDWARTVYEPIFDACPDKNDVGRLFGVIVKQVLIMSPLLFVQEGDGWESVYTRM